MTEQSGTVRGMEHVFWMLADTLMAEGYGFFVAVESANDILKEKIAQGPGTYKVHSKTMTFDITIRSKNDGDN